MSDHIVVLEVAGHRLVEQDGRLYFETANARVEVNSVMLAGVLGAVEAWERNRRGAQWRAQWPFMGPTL